MLTIVSTTIEFDQVGLGVWGQSSEKDICGCEKAQGEGIMDIPEEDHGAREPSKALGPKRPSPHEIDKHNAIHSLLRAVVDIAFEERGLRRIIEQYLETMVWQSFISTIVP